MVRNHFETIKDRHRIGLPEGVIDASRFDCIEEVLLAADAGITDYSSWMCDYILLGRPAFLYMPDIDNYGRDVGFFDPLENAPMQISRNMDELVESIKGFDAGEYEFKRVKYLNDMRYVFNDCSANDAVRLIESIIRQRAPISRL